MFHPTLRALLEDDFLVDYGVLANPRALLWALARSRQVKAVEQAMRTGELDDNAIRRFAGCILRDLEVGTLFPLDVALAAIAVCLRSRPTTFAGEFLNSLSSLKLAELPMSIRVGRLSRDVNLRLPRNDFRSFTLVAGESPKSDWYEIEPFKEPLSGHSEGVFAYGESNA